MKKKLSLTEKISLAENNAVDFMHACVTIALHDEYEVGVQRLRKVNLRRDEINEEMLEVMAQPRKSGREQAACRWPRRKWKSASRPCCRPRPCRRAGRGGGRDDRDLGRNLQTYQDSGV